MEWRVRTIGAACVGACLMLALFLPVTAAVSQPRVLGLLIATKSLKTGSVDSYLYPIAIMEKGRFTNASIQEFEPGMIQRKRAGSVLNRVRAYSVYRQGRRVGGYTVTKLGTLQLRCVPALVGRGRAPWAGALDFSRGEPSVAGQTEEIRVLQFIALSDPPVNQEFGVRAGYLPSPQESRLLASLAQDRLRKHLRNSPDIVPKGALKLKHATRLDVDRDGKAEVVADYAIAVAKPESVAPTEPNILKVHIIARTTGTPRLLLGLIALTAPGMERNEAYTLDAIVDVDGDGKAELLFGHSGFESLQFEIFTLNRGSYLKVFEGAGMGC